MTKKVMLHSHSRRVTNQGEFFSGRLSCPIKHLFRQQETGKEIRSSGHMVEQIICESSHLAMEFTQGVSSLLN